MPSIRCNGSQHPGTPGLTRSPRAQGSGAGCLPAVTTRSVSPALTLCESRWPL